MAASSYTYMSLKNKVLICTQSVEMSLAEVLLLRNVKLMMGGNQWFFTSRCLLMGKLCHKIAFFWGMSLILCRVCCNFNQAVYHYSLLTCHGWGGLSMSRFPCG